MQRFSREPLQLRRFLGLLALVALPQVSLGDPPVQQTCGPPKQIENGFMQPRMDAYANDSIITYNCFRGFKLIGTRVRKCVADENSAQWNASDPRCQRVFCGNPPRLKNGFYTMTSTLLTYGTVVIYQCSFGFSLIGNPYVTCDAGGVGGFWNGNVPICEAKPVKTVSTAMQLTKVHCETPVVKNGILLSGFKSAYNMSSIVTFKCVIGYFMVGSYLIRCNENYLWDPEVPSCRKISPNFCGAPLIPSGSVYPLHHQYKAGTKVIVFCNPQQCFPDETIEMSTVCQGYNFWEPSVWPCFLRTSPDTFKLKIRNGRIIGKKKKYIPGDNVTIQCYAGYSLRGSSMIRYIGGKTWLPGIPSCSLSFFFILLILAIAFIVLLLPVKMLCNKCFSP